jgi:hypothetical protein
MSNNPNMGIGASNQLNYIQSTINKTLALTMDVYFKEHNYSTHTNNDEKPS